MKMIGASTAYCCSTLVNGLVGASYIGEDNRKRVPKCARHEKVRTS